MLFHLSWLLLFQLEKKTVLLQIIVRKLLFVEIKNAFVAKSLPQWLGIVRLLVSFLSKCQILSFSNNEKTNGSLIVPRFQCRYSTTKKCLFKNSCFKSWWLCWRWVTEHKFVTCKTLKFCHIKRRIFKISYHLSLEG